MVTVIRPGMAGQRGFECTYGHFRRLVTVGVDVQMHALGVVGVNHLFKAFRRNVPRPLRTAVVVARPL